MGRGVSLPGTEDDAIRTDANLITVVKSVLSIFDTSACEAEFHSYNVLLHDWVSCDS